MSIRIGDAWVGTVYLGPDPVSNDLLKTLAEKIENPTFKPAELISWQKKFGDTNPAYFSEGIVIWLTTNNIWYVQHFVVTLNSQRVEVINSDTNAQYTKEGAKDWVGTFAKNTHMYEFINDASQIKRYMEEALFDANLTSREEQIGQCEGKIANSIRDTLVEHTNCEVGEVSFDYDCLHEGSFQIIVEIGDEDGD